MMAELSESPQVSKTHSDAFAEMCELAWRQVTERSHRSNGWFGAPVTGRLWPVVLGGLRAELQPLKIPNFGERRLTGPDAYSPYRPTAADSTNIQPADIQQFSVNQHVEAVDTGQGTPVSTRA